MGLVYVRERRVQERSSRDRRKREREGRRGGRQRERAKREGKRKKKRVVVVVREKIDPICGMMVN